MCVAPFTGGFEIGSAKGVLFTIAAGLFEAGYFHSLSRTYETAPFGVSYSIMRGGAMLIVAIISVLFMKEPLSVIKCAGLAVLTMGIFLTPNKDNDRIQRNGVLWALSCSVFIAGYHLCYGLALEENVSQVALFILSMLTSVPFLAFKSKSAAIKSIRTIPRSELKWAFTAGILSCTSFILFLYGLKNSYPGVAISLRNTSILFSQGLSVFLGERLTLVQWIGVCGIFTGAMMISH